MIGHHFTINATLDEAAKWWYATSDDVPGLATGAASLDELLVKLDTIIPELLELNKVVFEDDDDDDDVVTISYSVMAEASGQVMVSRQG